MRERPYRVREQKKFYRGQRQCGAGETASAFSPAPQCPVHQEVAPSCFLHGACERSALCLTAADGAAGHAFAVVVSGTCGDVHWFGAATEAAALVLAGDVGEVFSGEVAVFSRLHRFAPGGRPCRGG